MKDFCEKIEINMIKNIGNEMQIDQSNDLEPLVEKLFSVQILEYHRKYVQRIEKFKFSKRGTQKALIIFCLVANKSSGQRF